jgi:hypothetical protein
LNFQISELNSLLIHWVLEDEELLGVGLGGVVEAQLAGVAADQRDLLGGVEQIERRGDQRVREGEGLAKGKRPRGAVEKGKARKRAFRPVVELANKSLAAGNCFPVLLRAV